MTCFVIKKKDGEVYELDVPDEETLLLNISADAEVWLKGNPDAPTEHKSAPITNEE